MRAFLKRITIFLIPLFALIILYYLVDPYDHYSWQIIPVRMHNPRRDKVESYLHNGKYDYESFVLGSSRSMRQNFGENSFNFAVFDAHSEDIYCTLRFILDHCTVPPKLVIIGIDPELLHNRAAIIPDLVNEPLLSKYLIQNTINWINPTPKMLASIQQTLYHTVASVANYITNGSYDTFIETYPGTGTFINYYSRCNLQLVEPAHIDLMRERYYSFSAFSEHRIDYFDRTIALCKQNNIKVLTYITPMHPQVIEGLNEQGVYRERLAELKAYLGQINYDGFSYVDLSLPEFFGGDNHDFFDILHVGDYNAELIVERLSEMIKD